MPTLGVLPRPHAVPSVVVSLRWVRHVTRSGHPDKTYMACQCASAIVAEMSDWIRLGGQDSGCCGNALHTYGFHCPATAVSTSDYSRSHEAAVPYQMNWACAGDFSHGREAKLRAKHAVVLARLRRGELPMIAEFIGQPWEGKPVYYWARWNGITTLQRYTGAGHDHWSHISWYRSKANQRPYLWRPAPAPPKPPAPKPVPPAPKPVPGRPKYPGRVMRHSAKPTYDAQLKLWQTRMRASGWTVTPDGFFGARTQALVKDFQRNKNLKVDGLIGPATWNAAWNQ